MEKEDRTLVGAEQLQSCPRHVPSQSELLVSTLVTWAPSTNEGGFRYL